MISLRLTMYATGEQFFAIRNELSLWLSEQHITAELTIQPHKNQVCMTFKTTKECTAFLEQFEGRL